METWLVCLGTLSERLALAAQRPPLRRWGNSLGVRLPAAISREAGLQSNQTVALTVVAEGVLIRLVEPRPHPIGRLDADELERVRSIVEHPWHKSADSPPLKGGNGARTPPSVCSNRHHV